MQAGALSALGLPVYYTDNLLRRLYLDPLYEWRPLAQAIRAMFPFERRNWARASKRIAPDAELVNELCDLIVEETPVDDELFIIEGELMRHEAILDQLKTQFERQGVRVW